MKSWAGSLLILIFLSSNLQAATVYKKVDKDGNIVFSDTPMEDAEELDVPPVPTLKLDTTPKFKPAKKEKTEDFAYTSLAITSPVKDETFVNNQGTVTVSVQVAPKLRKGDQVQLLLNGVKRAGPSASTSFALSNLDRGSYSAEAQVIDAKGNVLISSATVPFHIKRNFIRAN